MSPLAVLRFVLSHPMNRGRPLSALARVARWQLASRLAGGALTVEWVAGARLRVRRGDTGLTGNLYTGLHEFPDMGFLLHALRETDLFIDVGANAGAYTVLACAARGARGRAFEPIPSTFARLAENIQINELTARVEASNIGLADVPGEILFTSAGDTINHALAPGESDPHAVRVAVSTLDASVVLDRPTLMKIDVEGFETPVLAGAQATLANPLLYAIIMELNGSGARYGHDEGRIITNLAGHGFRMWSYAPFVRELLPLGDKNQDSGNTIFIRDEALVRERLDTAAKVHLLGRSF